jgi:hypothetical protein
MPTPVTNPDDELRASLLDILKDNAEEPDDIADGTGTFTTFRTEYVLDELVAYIKAHDQALIESLLKAGPQDLKYKHPKAAKVAKVLNPYDEDEVTIVNRVNAQWRQALARWGEEKK